MTREIFFAHKAGIAESMNQALMISKYQGKALHKYCLTYDNITVEVLRDDKDEAKIGKLKEVVRYSNLYGAPSIHERFDQPHCTKHFRGTAYMFRVPKLRESIDPSQVAQKVKTLVKRELGLDSLQALECRVMALFKDGRISWDEVMEQHGKACTI